LQTILATGKMLTVMLHSDEHTRCRNVKSRNTLQQLLQVIHCNTVEYWETAVCCGNCFKPAVWLDKYYARWMLQCKTL